MKNKIGVYVCECGPNISSKIDIEKVVKKISELPDFKDHELVVKNHKLLCSVDGKAFLEKEIKDNELTHLVVAACSPRDHNTTFENVCKQTQLNPYLYTMVNIREHCAWIIPDIEEATEKAIQYIHSGMSRVLYQNPLYEKQLETNPDVLVIGGGVSGLNAALSLASKERRVFLIEKTSELGGKAKHFKRLLPRQADLNSTCKLIEKVEKHPQITVYKETELEKIVGFLGNFEIVLKNNNTETELLAGGVVIANGFELFDPKTIDAFNYNDEDDVYTALEIEKMLSETGTITLKNGKMPESAVLIHCVGRKEVGYCSSICCSYMLKIAEYIKEVSSDIKITDLHQDLCLPNKADEEFYNEVKKDDIDFIRIKDVSIEGCRVEIISQNDKKYEINPDMIILAPAITAMKENEHFADLLNLELHETGFFQEAHIKINPVSTNTEGVFVAGCSRGACDINESVIQAEAASGRILTQLIPGQKIIPEVKVSEVLEAYCTGCRTCLDVCGFGAIYFDDVRGVSVVNEAICRGCGNCVGSCPSGAIRSRHFTSDQLYQQVKEALR